MKVLFSEPIIRKNDFPGNYTIFSEDGQPLYAGHSSKVKMRIGNHRSCLRSEGLFHSGHNPNRNYNDGWYAVIYNVGCSDKGARLKLEYEVHSKFPDLVSSPGDKQKGKSLSEAAKVKLSQVRTGIKFSDEHKSKLSNAAREAFRNIPTRTCPHCGLEGKGGAMTRYHFDNCKRK